MPNRKSIWIDLDNTPHVPFFRPIIRELEAQGDEVLVTARDAFQVLEVANLYGLRYLKIGRHYGKNSLRKVLGLIWRSLQLLPFALRHRPSLALSHGSRSQILVSKMLRIPSIMIMDYEHARTPLLLTPRWEIVPSALSHEHLQCKNRNRILVYPGIKEDVYAPEFVPDESLPLTLGLDKRRIIVTVRPPATEAHYHRRESDALFEEFMNVALVNERVQVVLLPRNKAQESQLRKDWPSWFNDGSVIIPRVAVEGLNLLWHSDLVVSAGGTMNREAAALGVPVYSIFKGPLGAVDRELEAEGRLVLIKEARDVGKDIVLRQRDRGPKKMRLKVPPALGAILRHIDLIRSHEYSKSEAARSNRSK